MKKSNYLVLAAAVLILGACSSDPYKDMPRNCIDYHRTPVVCSPPVNSKDLINQPRKHIESVLGKNKIEDHKGHKVGSYRGGGIIIRYTPDEVSEMVEIYPENLDLDVDSVLSYLSAKSISVIPQPYVGEDGAAILWDGDANFYTIAALSDSNNIGKVNSIKIHVQPTSVW